jgi:hypothetical protein
MIIEHAKENVIIENFPFSRLLQKMLPDDITSTF